jgi:hypothetical protein
LLTAQPTAANGLSPVIFLTDVIGVGRVAVVEVVVSYLIGC